MVELEIPLTPGLSAAADGDYDNRHRLAEALGNGLPAISSQARLIGGLLDQDGFSRQLDFSSLVESRNRLFSSATSNLVRQTCELKLPFEIDHEAALATYQVPDELVQFSEAIRMIARYEHSTYPQAQYRHGDQAALSIDQATVAPGETQRSRKLLEVHRDGTLGQWQHVYVVTDSHPTEFFEWPEPGVAGSGRGIEPDELGPALVPPEYEVAFTNSTNLHRSPVIEGGGHRTFLRLSYTHAN